MNSYTQGKRHNDSNCIDDDYTNLYVELMINVHNYKIVYSTTYINSTNKTCIVVIYTYIGATTMSS